MNDENLIPHRFQPGQSGNPGGKTSEQRQREMRNAEMATRLQEYLLEREVRAIEEPADVAASGWCGPIGRLRHVEQMASVTGKDAPANSVLKAPL